MNPLLDNEAVTAAVAEFPELERLVDLRNAGWRLSPVHGTNGEITSVLGVRSWPGCWTDVIGVYVTDAQGLRCSPAGELVWDDTGGLVEVVHGLLALPAPDERGAPQLVRGSAPKLWTPGSA